MADCVASVLLTGAARAIVVDNASFDGSVEHLERTAKNKRLSIVRNSKNYGFAAACNIGVKGINGWQNPVPEPRQRSPGR